MQPGLSQPAKTHHPCKPQTHHDSQERVLSEIDCFGRDREVTYADLTGDNFPYLQATIKEALRL